MRSRSFQRKILRLFGRYQRPVCWVILGMTIVAMALIFTQIWKVKDPLATILTLLVLFQQAVAMVQEVENEVEDGAQAEK